MNVLGLVFGILLICTCTFSLSMHKHLLSKPIETTCKNHWAASRKICNSYESEYYNALRAAPKKEASRTSSKPPSSSQPSQEEEEPLSLLNGECSRLNLRPLIEKGRNENPILYETAAKLFRELYQKPLFGEEVRLEYQLLDAILASAASEKDDPVLEKLRLQDKNVKRPSPLQSVYYRMLKGTKPKAKDGYPCLTDYISIKHAHSPLCLRHASAEMLSTLFNPKAAFHLQKEMRKSKIPLSKERILEICGHAGVTGLSEDFLELLDLQTAIHRLPDKKILVEQEGDVSLRKQIFLPNT